MPRQAFREPLVVVLEHQVAGLLQTFELIGQASTPPCLSEQIQQLESIIARAKEGPEKVRQAPMPTPGARRADSDDLATKVGWEEDRDGANTGPPRRPRLKSLPPISQASTPGHMDEPRQAGNGSPMSPGVRSTRQTTRDNSQRSIDSDDPSGELSAKDAVDPLFCPNMAAKRDAQREALEGDEEALCSVENGAHTWTQNIAKVFRLAHTESATMSEATSAVTFAPVPSRPKLRGLVTRVQSVLNMTGPVELEHSKRREHLKALNRSMLSMTGDHESITATTLKTVLSSDKSTAEMLEWIFDRPRLQHETKSLRSREKIAEKLQEKSELKRRMEEGQKEAQRRRDAEQAEQAKKKRKKLSLAKRPSQPLLLTPFTPTRCVGHPTV